jgi:hypothetical protein
MEPDNKGARPALGEAGARVGFQPSHLGGKSRNGESGRIFSTRDSSRKAIVPTKLWVSLQGHAFSPEKTVYGGLSQKGSEWGSLPLSISEAILVPV